MWKRLNFLKDLDAKKPVPLEQQADFLVGATKNGIQSVTECPFDGGSIQLGFRVSSPC